MCIIIFFLQQEKVLILINIIIIIIIIIIPFKLTPLQENVHLDPNDSETKKKIQVAYKGLQQLGMYSQHSLGGMQNPNWSVTLEQNPMPKPSHL